METTTNPPDSSRPYPIDIHLEAALSDRNRLTCAFRFILAFPHVLMAGGPLAAVLMWGWTAQDQANGVTLGAGGGALGAAAGLAAVISWFWILFTKRHPEGLWNLAAFYLRWRVRAVAYTTLLRDEFPPFGDAGYPAAFLAGSPPETRDRLTVALRLLAAVPHILIVWVLGIGWVLTTMVAWFSILFTGRYPEALYGYAIGVLRWNTRLEGYILLLTDEYPPFSMQ